MRILLLLVISAFLINGCASQGFNRGKLKDQVGVKNPEVDDAKIKDILDKEANLPKPFKLGIYFKRPKNGGIDRFGWRWNKDDKKIIEEFSSNLEERDFITDVVPILGNIVKDESLKSIRVAAARHDVDAVLIIDGVASIDRYTNGLSATYILILPAFLLPGSEADSLFIANASLWDVRNEYLYLTAETESTVHETYIAAFGSENEELIDKAKSKALNQLREKLGDMIDGL